MLKKLVMHIRFKIDYRLFTFMRLKMDVLVSKWTK